MAMQCLSSKVNIINVGVVESSQKMAKEYFDNNNENIVVVAESIINAVGREKNTWYAPRGGLWFTAALRLKKYLSTLTIFCGICMHHTLKTLSNEKIEIKWPNDIYLNGKKMCGIITFYESELDCYLIGIGVDTNVEKFTDELKLIATSLFLETGKIYDNKEILTRFLDFFFCEYPNFIDNGLDAYVDYYNKYDFLLNKQINVKLLDNNISGKYLGLNNEGTINLSDNGKIKKIMAGSIDILKEKE